MKASARKGQSLRKTYTAQWYNKMNKSPKRDSSAPGTNQLTSATLNIKRNSAGTEASRFDPVALVDPIVTSATSNEEDELLATNGCTVSVDANDLTNNNIAITQDPLPEDGDGGRAVAIGVTWARIYVLDVNDEFATVSTSGRLETGSEGIVSIIAKHPDWAADDYHLALVVIRGGGGGKGAILCQAPSGGIPAASAGTVRPTIFGMATCDLIDETTGDVFTPNRTQDIYNLVDIPIPEDVIFKAEPVGGKYFIDVSSCGLSTPPTAAPDPGLFPDPV